jgi:hypothetical protein
VKSFSGRNPVFVDPTGRRQRTIRRAGAFLVLPAAGYVVLLISSLLGGPSVNTPLIPVPDHVRPLSEPRPVSTPTPARATEAPDSDETTPGESGRSTGPDPTEPTTTPTQLPTTAPSVTVAPGSPTTAPTILTRSPGTTPGTPGHGKPSARPGRTKSPIKP